MTAEKEAPRAYTPEEVREQFFQGLRANADYWANVGVNKQDACYGLVFSILNMFDGTSMNLPAMDIVMAPHPDDKAFHQGEGENWYEPGQVINDCSMHDEWSEVNQAPDEQ